MNVLSLFDGIACGRVALERANIPVERYIASEIEKTSIRVATTNYPDIEEIGDVRNVDVNTLPHIDLLIGGSPCTNLSFSGKREGLSAKKGKEKEKVVTLEQYFKLKEEGFEFEGYSYLFWEYVRILKALQEKNPNIYFLLENVVMAKEWEDVFTKVLGVEPIKINSSLVSAQNRVRLYWTNIPFVEMPKDKGIKLQDILEDIEFVNSGAIRGRYIEMNKATIIGRRIDENGHRKDTNKTIPIVQCLEVRSTNRDKSNCLTTAVKDNVLTPLPIGRHIDAYGMISGCKLPFRYYTRREYERLQTLPDGYTDSISESAAKKAIGNGWTVDVIVHLLKGLRK